MLQINFNLFRLSLKNLRYNSVRIFFVFMGLVSISVILYVLISLSEGIRTNIIDKYLQTIPVNEIQVSKKSFVMNIPFLNNFSFNSNAEITDTTLAQITAIAGVNKVYPLLNINFPVSILIELWGFQFNSDLAVTGISSELIESDNLQLSRKFIYDMKKDANIPALVSYSIIDLYNSNFSEANKLPKISYKAIIGRHFTLTFGKSIQFASNNKEKKIRCEISGLSKRADLLGLTIPLETVKQLNKWYKPDYQPSYSSVILKTSAVKDMPIVSEKIRKMGFNVYSLNEIVDKINIVSFGILAIVLIVIISISTAVVFNIFNYYMTLIKSQEQDIKIMRLIGFSNSNIRRLYIFQSLFVTAIASCMSIAIGRTFVKTADWFVTKKIFEFTKVNISLFSTPYWLDFSLVSAALFITLLTVFLAIKKNT